ncbi:unnamed protein product [Adineta steineri]|uniref:Uncharacterized protein n=1 Tax=Adineta steineri TaxID=433720 RepID=A0A816D9Z1_9BILA|nr:unnamed protein product [Adineta steineri]CAF1635398.1 unnamed protein product [Adineta steineri]
MLKKFLRWTGNVIDWNDNVIHFYDYLGLKKPSESEIQEEKDSRMRSQYFHPTDNFADRIDQLLGALDKIYVDQQADLLRLKKAGV